jgi:hypothetical protein
LKIKALMHSSGKSMNSAMSVVTPLLTAGKEH